MKIKERCFDIDTIFTNPISHFQDKRINNFIIPSRGFSHSYWSRASIN